MDTSILTFPLFLSRSAPVYEHDGVIRTADTPGGIMGIR